jgi:hypothetical protein
MYILSLDAEPWKARPSEEYLEWCSTPENICEPPNTYHPFRAIDYAIWLIDNEYKPFTAPYYVPQP